MNESKTAEQKLIIEQVEKKLHLLSKEELSQKIEQIEERLFDFANFKEAKIVLLYLNTSIEVDTTNIIQTCMKQEKTVVLPFFDSEKISMRFLRIMDIDKDVIVTSRGREPSVERCKHVPITHIDIAVFPGYVFDEKGGRIGPNEAYYYWLVSKLPSTTRKIAIAFQEQFIYPSVTDIKSRNLDIILTDKRVIFKI